MMNEETREALEASIQHWEENIFADTPYEASIGGRYCALCNMFAKGPWTSCEGCPVKDHTGQVNCEGTPYPAAANALLS